MPCSAGTGDESSRGGSWRDSGSRLGLGAGADRDASAESNSQNLLSARRDRSGFQDRSSSRGVFHSPAMSRYFFLNHSLCVFMPSSKVFKLPGSQHCQSSASEDIRTHTQTHIVTTSLFFLSLTLTLPISCSLPDKHSWKEGKFC